MYKKGGTIWFDAGDKCFHEDFGILLIVGSCEDGDVLAKVVNPDGFMRKGTAFNTYDRFGAQTHSDGTNTHRYFQTKDLKYLGGDYDGLDEL